jgi:hypothetical protein
MEEIRGRLSQCQIYSNTLNASQVELLRSKLNKSSAPFFSFRQVKKYLRTKDAIVRFYSQDKKEFISVCSDFFSLEGAFDMSKCFFEDIDALVMAISCVNRQCLVSLIWGEIQIGSISFDLGHTILEDVGLSVARYVEGIQKLRYRVDKNCILKVFEELKPVQTLSEKEALRLLEDISQIDEYIL